MDRRMTNAGPVMRQTWRSDGELRREVASNCKDIADYLLDLAREGDLEPALGVLVDALDHGIEELEGEARDRAEHVYDSIRQHHIARTGRKMLGEGVDPFFWG